MKKMMLAAVLLLLLAESVHAEVLFDGWVQDSAPFEAGGQGIKVSFRRQNQLGTFFTHESTFLVDRGGCGTKDLIQYCLEDVDYERAVFKDGREYPMIHARIESLEPAITVSQDYSTTTPHQFERIEASVTLRNEGDLRADSVRLEIPLPPHVRVVAGAGELAGNTIIFDTFLLPKQEKSYMYVIEARDLVDFDITPKVSYRFFDKQKTAYGDKETIKVKLPFKFDQDLSDDAIKVGQTLTYNITIKNTAKRGDVNILALTITIPPGLSVVSFDGIAKEGRKYMYSDSLRKDEEHVISVVLRADELGDHAVRLDATVAAEGSTMQKTSEHTVIVALSDITAYLDISPASVRSDADFTLIADLKNRKPETIKGIITTVSFDPPIIETMRYPGIDLRGRQRASIVKKEITAPQVDSPTNVIVTLSGSYIDESGTFHFSAGDTIRIEPFVRPLSVSYHFNETPVPGGNVSIIATVKNVGSIALTDVSVLDSIEGIKVIDGEPYFDGGFLEAGKEVEFSYAVHIPETHAQEYLEVTTFMNAKINEEFFKIKTTEELAFNSGSVRPTAPATLPDVDKPIEDKEYDGLQEEKSVGPEEKGGFFARLLLWLMQLF